MPAVIPADGVVFDQQRRCCERSLFDKLQDVLVPHVEVLEHGALAFAFIGIRLEGRLAIHENNLF